MATDINSLRSVKHCFERQWTTIYIAVKLGKTPVTSRNRIVNASVFLIGNFKGGIIIQLVERASLTELSKTKTKINNPNMALSGRSTQDREIDRVSTDNSTEFLLIIT